MEQQAHSVGIHAAGLAVSRGGRMVLRDVSFSLKAGEALLLKGPNGAGKSTLLRAVAGLLPLESGQILRNGVNISDDPDGHRAGLMYVGHGLGLKASLTARENLAFWRAAMGGSGDVAAALTAFGLLPVADMAVGRLSAGQQRRVSLARLLLAEAPLWLLDEPTVTLDAAACEQLTVLMNRHCAKGGMIMAATHQDLALEKARTLHLMPASVPAFEDAL
jgi:heme exporter protein A